MERYVQSFGASLAVAVFLNALLFAIKAVSPGFEGWSEATLGHAWLYMGVLALAVFVSLGLTPIRLTSNSRGLAMLVAGAAGAAGIASTVIVAVAALMAAIE